MTRAHFKFLAKQQLRGKVGTLFAASLLFVLVIIGSFAVVAAITALLASALEETGAIIGIVLMLLVYVFAFFFAVPAFNIGYIMMLQNIVKNPNEKPKATSVFRGFKHCWASFKVLFLIYFFTSLWSMLFVIPGIVKMYSYSQALYILAENPDMGALEAINRSKAMMRGRKFDFYVLWNLSFYPWFLLLPFTLGFLGIWLFPYMDLTRINFYNHAKAAPGSPDYGIPTYGRVLPAHAFIPAFYGSQPTSDNFDATNTQPAETKTETQPVKEEPVKEEPVKEEPVKEEPVKEETVTETPVEETPVSEETVTEETPVEETPVEETPVEETPVTEEPSDEETSEDNDEKTE